MSEHDYNGLEITITIGVDGRLYCQDLPVPLVAVVRALCPNDTELIRREAVHGVIELSTNH